MLFYFDVKIERPPEGNKRVPTPVGYLNWAYTAFQMVTARTSENSPVQWATSLKLHHSEGPLAQSGPSVIVACRV